MLKYFFSSELSAAYMVPERQIPGQKEVWDSLAEACKAFFLAAGQSEDTVLKRF